MRIGENDEVQLKGPHVMEGYHNLPDATADAFTPDGWLRTGDKGSLDDEGFLTITGRIKEAVQDLRRQVHRPPAIEAKFKVLCPYASQFMVFGNERNYVVALVTLDPEAIEDWAKENGLSGDYATIVKDPKTREMVDDHVNELNGQLKPLGDDQEVRDPRPRPVRGVRRADPLDEGQARRRGEQLLRRDRRDVLLEEPATAAPKRPGSGLVRIRGRCASSLVGWGWGAPRVCAGAPRGRRLDSRAGAGDGGDRHGAGPGEAGPRLGRHDGAGGDPPVDGLVFANPSLRRVQLALVGSMIGDGAFATAVAVWAYGVGGATAVGVWTAVRLTLMALTAPVAAGLADRFPRLRVMVVADAVRGLLVGACAVLCCSGPRRRRCSSWPRWSASWAHRSAPPSARSCRRGHPSRGAHGLQRHQQHDREPVVLRRSGARCGARGDHERRGRLRLRRPHLRLGPWSGAGHRVRRPRPQLRCRRRGDGSAEPEQAGGFVQETLAGFRSIGDDRDLTVATARFAAQTVVAGASAVVTVVVAVEVLGTGPAGVGLPRLRARHRGDRRRPGRDRPGQPQRLGQDLTVGVLLWSLPLLMVTVAPVPVAAFAMMAVLGFANPLVDVNLDTIVQRVTPTRCWGVSSGRWRRA